MNKTIVCIAIAIVGGSGSALAVPTTLGVDFRSAAWQAAAGKTSYSSGNVTDTAAAPAGSTLTTSLTTGIGVGAPSAFSGILDILNVAFSLGSGTNLTGAWVTNLFSGTLETGSLLLNTTKGLEVFSFSGLSSSSKDPLGDVYINFGGAYNVLSAQFYALNPLSILGAKDYSVAGFSSSSVPDGGTTLTLLGIGLVSLTVLRRRFAL
jgi:VPDSG-CTERM motif